MLRVFVASALCVGLTGCVNAPTERLAGSAMWLEAQPVVTNGLFYHFIAADSRVEVLAEGLEWAEGPVWVEPLNALLFSDVATDTLYRWSENAGLTLYLRPSGHPVDDAGYAWRGANGLAVDAAGQLLLAQQSRRTLARMRAPLDNPAPDFAVLVERYSEQRLNSPNDLVVHANGDIFFTDPPYGLAGFEHSPDKDLAFSGVFRLTQSGQLHLVAGDIEKPNGIALSPDQSELFVSNSEPGMARVVAIDLDANGNAAGRRVFYDAAELESEGPGSTDGMAMHCLGYLFVTIPNGVGILAPDGELLGRLALGQVTNLAFDTGCRYLYLTAPQRLLRIPLVSTRTLRPSDNADAVQR